MRKIEKASYKVTPWRNGLGITAEIARYPETGNYLWRMSRAKISSHGPFSLFPGYGRWLCLLDGDPVLLNGRKLEILDPIQFSGDAVTEYRLTGGPATDLGLIFDREKVRAEMKLIQGLVNLKKGTHLIFNLKKEDTLLIETPTDLNVEASVLISLIVEKRFV